VTGPSLTKLGRAGSVFGLGLAVLIGCVGCVWDERHGAAPVASTSASVRIATGASAPNQPAPPPLEARRREQPAPAPPDQQRIPPGNRVSPAPLCESVVDGLTILGPCTGAPGEARAPVAKSTDLSHPKCVVNLEGLNILRDCQGTKGERPAPRGAAP
jgi:hypothetical protein